VVGGGGTTVRIGDAAVCGGGVAILICPSVVAVCDGGVGVVVAVCDGGVGVIVAVCDGGVVVVITIRPTVVSDCDIDGVALVAVCMIVLLAWPLSVAVPPNNLLFPTARLGIANVPFGERPWVDVSFSLASGVYGANVLAAVGDSLTDAADCTACVAAGTLDVLIVLLAWPLSVAVPPNKLLFPNARLGVANVPSRGRRPRSLSFFDVVDRAVGDVGVIGRAPAACANNNDDIAIM
jgi:hypothetical protein